MKKTFKARGIFMLLSFFSVLFYSADTPTHAESLPPAGQPAVTIKNRCWASAGIQGKTRIHIYTLGKQGLCQPTEDWVEIPVNTDIKWHTKNSCRYIVEPWWTIHSPAAFSDNNAVIKCEMNGLICKCNNE